MSVNRALLGVAVAVIFTAATAKADTVQLFSSISYSEDANSPAPIDSQAVYESSIDVRGLAGMPSRVSVSIPEPSGNLTAVIALEQMDRRSGFTERDPDACSLGETNACEEIPVPGYPVDKFSYTWVGRGDGYDLRLTIHDGNAVGVLSGPGGRFAIRWDELRKLRFDYFQMRDDFDSSERKSDMPSQDLTKVRRASYLSRDVVNAATIARIEPVPSGVSRSVSPELDMLILVTEEARIEAGGNPSDCTDTNGVLSYIYHNIDSVNRAFQWSAVSGQIGAVTVARLNGFTLIPYSGSSILANRNQIQGHSNITAFRNSVGADVVSVLIGTQASLGACGTAFIQRNDCGGAAPSCGPGTMFSEYTYFIEAVQCIWMDTFTHELGHVLGAEHDRQHTGASNSTASFNHSFGFGVSSQSFGFETIMSQWLDGTYYPTRLLQFSNPDVLYNGVPTGSNQNLKWANNAKTLNQLLPMTASFRSRASVDQIFSSGFDGSTSCSGVIF